MEENPEIFFSYMSKVKDKNLRLGLLKFEKSMKLTLKKYARCWLIKTSQYSEQKILRRGGWWDNQSDESAITDVGETKNNISKTWD